MTSEVFSSAYDGTSISNAGVGGSTETVAAWGDIVVIGLPGYVHSSDPNPGGTVPASSWGSAPVGTTINPGYNGKAFLYNKSTGTTVELFQPPTDINHQQSFGYGVVINDTYVAVLAPQQTYYGHTPKIYLYDHAGAYQGVRIEGPQMNSGLGTHTKNPGIIITDSYIVAIASMYANSQSRVYVYDLAGIELGYILSNSNNSIQGISVIGNTVITGSGNHIRKFDITGISGGQVITSYAASVNAPSSQFGSIEVLDNDYFVVSYLNKHPTGCFQVRRMSDLAQVGSDFVGNAGALYYGNQLACNGSGLLAVSTLYLSENSGGYVDVYSHNAGSLTLESTIVQSDVGTTKTTHANYIDFGQDGLVIADRAAHLVYPFTIGSSVQPRAITVTGDVQQGAFSPYVAGGYSCEFDGSSSVTVSDATQLGAGDFSIEFWMKTSQTSCSLLNPDSGNGVGRWGVFLDEGDLTFQDGYMGGAGVWTVDVSSILDNTWHHVAISRSSETFSVYLDGISQSSKTGTFANNTTNHSVVTGLKICDGFKPDFIGLLNDLRIVVGSAVYTDAFTPPTEPLTLTSETFLLTCNKPYMSAVGNEYSPASLSTTEVYGHAAVSSLISGYTQGGPRLGADASISPDGDWIASGAPSWATSSTLQGSVYLLDINDPSNITTHTKQWENGIQNNGFGGVAVSNTPKSAYFGRTVALSDEYLVASCHHPYGGQITSSNFTTAYQQNITTIPSDNNLGWAFMPAAALYDLSNPTGNPKYLMSCAAHSEAVYGENRIAINGNHVIVKCNDGNDYWRGGWWVYDISDITLIETDVTTATTNNTSFGDVIWPKYYIPWDKTATNSSWYSTSNISSVGDYIVTSGTGNNSYGIVEVWKISELRPIAAANGQVDPVTTWQGSSNLFAGSGPKANTDGTDIYIATHNSSTPELYVYDMTMSTLKTTLNVSSLYGLVYPSGISVNGNYLAISSLSNDGGTGSYVILDKNDNYSLVSSVDRADLFSSGNYFGRRVDLAEESDIFMMTWVDYNGVEGTFIVDELVATPAGYSSVSHSSTLSGDISTERSAPYGFADYSAASHGGSAYFDGTGDELTIAASDDFNFGTGDFTIEMWIKPGSGSDATVWKNDNMRIQVFPDFDHGDGTSDYIQVQESSNVELKYPLGYAFNGVWVHIALVRENGTFKLFANGSELTNTANYGTPSEGFDYSSTGQMFIGSNGAGNNMQGHISDVRVVKGSAVYTADFTVPTAPLTAVTGTTLLLPFDDATIIDKSGSSVIDVQGDVAVSSVAPPYVGGKSLTFDGSGDYIEALDANISLSGDFTIEAWVKPTTLSGQIIGLADGSGVKIATNGSNYDVVFHDGSSDVITSSSSYSTTASVSLTTTVEGTESAARLGYASASCESYYVLTAPNSSSAASNAGKVEIYRVADNTLLATVANPNTSTGAEDYFGRAVAITETHLLVGAPGMEHNQTSFVGAAYLFDISNLSSPVLLRTLRPSDTGIQQSFGQTVAMSDTYYSISNNVGTATTSPKPSERQVWLYGLDDHNAAAVHSFNNRSDSNSSNSYGTGMFISDTHIAISDRMYKVGGTNYAGRVYVYALSDFSEVSAIDNHDFNNNNNFGGNGTKGVLLNSTHLFVSEHSNRGRVYVYDLSTSNLEHTLESINDSDENFGQGLDISDDYLVISGKSRFVIYDPSGDFSSELMSFDPSPVPAYSDYFGQWVAISGTKIIISAWGLDPSAGANAGGAYVYELPAADFTAWKHVAVSRSSGTVKMFIDGVSVGNSSGHTVTVGTSGGVMLGSNTSNGNLLTGEIADVIVLAYAKYTVDFIVPAGQSWGQAVVAL